MNLLTWKSIISNINIQTRFSLHEFFLGNSFMDYSFIHSFRLKLKQIWMRHSAPEFSRMFNLQTLRKQKSIEEKEDSKLRIKMLALAYVIRNWVHFNLCNPNTMCNIICYKNYVKLYTTIISASQSVTVRKALNE